MNTRSRIKPSRAAPSSAPLTGHQLQHLGEMFRLLGEPSRLRILLALQDEARCVGDVASEAGLSQSLVSHHLRLLRAAGLVQPERAGKHIFYRLSDEHVAHMLSDMLVHVQDCVD